MEKIFMVKRDARHFRGQDKRLFMMRNKGIRLVSQLGMIDKKISQINHFFVKTHECHAHESGANHKKIKEVTPAKDADSGKHRDKKEIAPRFNFKGKNVKERNCHYGVDCHYAHQPIQKNFFISHQAQIIKAECAKKNRP